MTECDKETIKKELNLNPNLMNGITISGLEEQITNNNSSKSSKNRRHKQQDEYYWCFFTDDLI